MRLARFRLSQMSAAPAAAKAICLCAHLLLLRFCCNYTALLCFVGLCVPRKQLTSQKTPTQPPNCRVCNNSTNKNTKSLATFIYYWFCVPIGSNANIFSNGIYVYVNFPAVCLGWGGTIGAGYYLWAFWHIRPLSGHFGRYVIVFGRKSLLATCVLYAVCCVQHARAIVWKWR